MGAIDSLRNAGRGLWLYGAVRKGPLTQRVDAKIKESMRVRKEVLDALGGGLKLPSIDSPDLPARVPKANLCLLVKEHDFHWIVKFGHGDFSVLSTVYDFPILRRLGNVYVLREGAFRDPMNLTLDQKRRVLEHPLDYLFENAQYIVTESTIYFRHEHTRVLLRLVPGLFPPLGLAGYLTVVDFTRRTPHIPTRPTPIGQIVALSQQP